MADFDEIYNLYFRDVYRYLFALSGDPSIAEEITQETFFKALQKLDTFDGRGCITPWLFRIARNGYISFLRKDARFDRNIDLALLPGEETPETVLLRHEASAALHSAVSLLPDPYQEVFVLRAFGGLSYGKIAGHYGKPESWARVTYHRATLKLKEALQ